VLIILLYSTVEEAGKRKARADEPAIATKWRRVIVVAVLRASATSGRRTVAALKQRVAHPSALLDRMSFSDCEGRDTIVNAWSRLLPGKASSTSNNV